MACRYRPCNTDTRQSFRYVAHALGRPQRLEGLQQTASKRWWLRGLPLMVLAACNDGTTPSDGEPPGGTTAPGDGVVRCSYYYRQSNEVMEGQTGDEPIFQFEERLLTVGPDEDTSELLGQITLALNYDVAEFDSDSISLSATAGEARIFSILYQLNESMPQNQFVGGHGFTGLLYFTHPTGGGDYQAFCESVR